LGLAPISSWQVNIKEMLRSIPTISAARRFWWRWRWRRGRRVEGLLRYHRFQACCLWKFCFKWGSPCFWIPLSYL
jgi:hypothetical protein